MKTKNEKEKMDISFWWKKGKRWKNISSLTSTGAGASSSCRNLKEKKINYNLEINIILGGK